MPYKPKHPCSTPGCPYLTPVGQRLCTRHRSEEQLRYNRSRPAHHSFYNSQQWRNFRAKALEVYGPYCVDCGYTQDLEVDHLVPIRERPDLALDLSNVRVRCKRCHSRRTAKEHARWGGRVKSPQPGAI